MSIGIIDWSTAALKRRKQDLRTGGRGVGPTFTDVLSGMGKGAKGTQGTGGGGNMPTGGGGGGEADANKGWQPPEKKKKGGGGGGGGGGGTSNTNIALPLYASGGSAKLPAHWGGEYLGISRNEGQPEGKPKASPPIGYVEPTVKSTAGEIPSFNLGGPTGSPPPEGRVVTGLNPNGTWQTNPMEFYDLFGDSGAKEAGSEEAGSEEE